MKAYELNHEHIGMFIKFHGEVYPIIGIHRTFSAVSVRTSDLHHLSFPPNDEVEVATSPELLKGSRNLEYVTTGELIEHIPTSELIEELANRSRGELVLAMRLIDNANPPKTRFYLGKEMLISLGLVEALRLCVREEYTNFPLDDISED